MNAIERKKYNKKGTIKNRREREREKSKRKIEKVLSIKRRISKYGKTVFIPIHVAKPSSSILFSLDVFMPYICVTATEITMQKRKCRRESKNK